MAKGHFVIGILPDVMNVRLEDTEVLRTDAGKQCGASSPLVQLG
jgi:hypothetical protein